MLLHHPIVTGQVNVEISALLMYVWWPLLFINTTRIHINYPTMRTKTKLMFLATCICGLIFLSWNMSNIKSSDQKLRHQLKDKIQTTTMRRANNAPIAETTTLKRNSMFKLTSQLKRFTAFSPTLVNKTDINPAINEFFTLGENETRDKYINLHQYNFLLNTHICKKRKLFLLIVVHSATYSLNQRKNIRSTYGSVHSHKGRQLGVVFMLGHSNNQKTEESLEIESQTFGDIVQGDFYDSYRNLSRKHIMAMHWYFHHCSSEFILKVDDDTFVNPFLIVDTLVKERTDKMVLHCSVVSDGRPYRILSSNWYTSEQQYPFPVFPPYCLGFAYITTPRVWEALYRASEDQRMMNMDDVFVSVILSLKANIGKVALKNVMECYTADSLVSEEHFALILNRHYRCRDKSFELWKITHKENKTQGNHT